MTDQRSSDERRPQVGAVAMRSAPPVGVAETLHNTVSATAGMQTGETQPVISAAMPAVGTLSAAPTDAPNTPIAAVAPTLSITERATDRLEPNTPPAPQMVDRARAQTFGQALRILLQRRGLYVSLTETYLLPQLHDRLRAVDGAGIQIASLRAYLRGEALPNEAKTRLIADALGAPRGLLLYVAGYLTPDDLAHYPGPQLTLAAVEADIRELEALPLAPATKARIAHDLRISARIVCLLAPDRIGLHDGAIGASACYEEQATAPDEREQLIEQLIDLWATPAPPAPPLTTVEEGMQPTA